MFETSPTETSASVSALIGLIIPDHVAMLVSPGQMVRPMRYTLQFLYNNCDVGKYAVSKGGREHLAFFSNAFYLLFINYL